MPKAPNRLQIETVEKMLLSAFNKRRNEVAEAKETADIEKFDKDAQEINKAAHKIYEMIEQLKVKVEKNPKLTVDLDSYSSSWGKMKKSAQNDTKAYNYITHKSKSYGHNPYLPDWDEEAARIENYILSLKLGTALLEDMQKMLDMISKLK